MKLYILTLSHKNVFLLSEIVPIYIYIYERLKQASQMLNSSLQPKSSTAMVNKRYYRLESSLEKLLQRDTTTILVAVHSHQHRVAQCPSLNNLKGEKKGGLSGS